MFGLIPFAGSSMDRWNGGNGDLFRLFDEFEKSFWNGSVSEARQFRTDIVDKGDRYVLSAELPGFQKEDIQVDVDGHNLVISARQNQEFEENKDNYIRRERRFGTFSRSFDITGIQAEGIHAAYENGVLTLDLPKKQAQQLPPSRQIPIQ